MLILNDAGQFVLLARSRDLVNRAEQAALDLSVPATARMRHKVYFSTSPYSVLQFWDQADAAARARLQKLKDRVSSSLAIDADRRFLMPADKELIPFQRAGIAYALDTPGGVLIGDEPGLGKTVQAIVVANEIQAGRVIVVCPGSVRLQWEAMIRAWQTIELRPVIRVIKRAIDGVNPYANWTIVSYELMAKPEVHEQLLKLKPDLLVLDEAHYCKTVDSNRTRAAFGRLDEPGSGLAAASQKVLALTGTPLPNRPKEGYTLARALAWESIDFMSEVSYSFAFNPSVRVSKQTPEGTWQHRVEERSGRLLELQARLRGNFMVRRLEKNVQTQLPQERYHVTYIEPDGAIRKVLKAEEPLLLRLKDFEDLEGLSIEDKAHIATLRREMGEAKIPRVADHIKTILAGSHGSKLLVFAYHRSVLKGLYERLEAFGPALYWGGMSPTAQHGAKVRFLNDPKCRVWLGQINASGAGLDGLQDVSSHILFAEFSWVPGDNAQAVRRLKRIGQQKSVLAEFAIAPGGLCEKILGKSLDKLATITTALD